MPVGIKHVPWIVVTILLVGVVIAGCGETGGGEKLTIGMDVPK